MATYGVPPTRRNDFYEWYAARRNPNTLGGSRVLQVETPYGEVLASRNKWGEPVARSGTEGGDIMALAMDQLAQDNNSVPTVPITVRTPDGQPPNAGNVTYARRPFEALTGVTNFTPYGTVSSRIPETEEQRVAREWNQLVTQEQNGGEFVEPVAESYTPLQQAQIAARLERDMAMTPGTPQNNAWVKAENERRAASNLGPLDTAYEDFVADRAAREQEDQMASQLEKQARRAERQYRTETGRRTRTGEMTPTRSSSITPSYVPTLRENARNLARQILRGESPDAITQGWQNLTRGAIAGAPVPMTPEERYQQQQSRESSERMGLSRQANQRAQTQFEQNQLEFQQQQAEREELQDALIGYQSATTEAERNKVIRESAALQKFLGIRPDFDPGLSRTDYSTYANRLSTLERKILQGNKLTAEEESEASFLRDAISKYTQDESRRQGIVPKPPTAPQATLPEGKIIIQNGQRFKVTNGQPVPIK